jgi:ribosome maturation factor RimP
MGAQRPFLLKGAVHETVSTTFAKERTLQDEIAPAVESRVPGVRVLAVELPSPSRIRVFIDHEDGVDHALCERVTHVLDAYRMEYGIEVSSPGPDRPLRTREHFADAVGARVSVRVEGGRKSRRRGVLIEVGDETITLDAGDAGEIHIPYEAIVRANLIDEGLTT